MDREKERIAIVWGHGIRERRGRAHPFVCPSCGGCQENYVGNFRVICTEEVNCKLLLRLTAAYEKAHCWIQNWKQIGRVKLPNSCGIRRAVLRKSYTASCKGQRTHHYKNLGSLVASIGHNYCCSVFRWAFDRGSMSHWKQDSGCTWAVHDC